MTIIIEHIIKLDDQLKEFLYRETHFIKSQLLKIMSNTETALAKLAALGTQLDKVKAEVQALKDAAAAADTPQSVLDAIDSVISAVTAIDDINPDASAPAPTE